MYQKNRILSLMGYASRQVMGKLLILLLLCAFLVGMVGCGQQSAQVVPGTPTTSADSFVNPVIDSDFPDPSILYTENTYYAYATNGYGKHIQVASSLDLLHWTPLPDAMPALPSWADMGGSYVWAPGVIQIGATYVMYYTARDAQSHRQCIGVATSAKPAGKFKDTSSRPLVCQTDQGGTIDPSPFRDGQTLYLYFKNDGNCCGQTTYLYVQQLSPDGLHVVGYPQPLIHNEQVWEGNVVEAPQMFKHNGRYYLFFSANNYATSDYAVGYAFCQAATGPCTQAANNPILASRLQKPPVIGPGGEYIFQVGQQTWIAYHAWQVTADGSLGNNRMMCLDRLDWQGDRPQVQGPTTSPQPIP